MTTRYLLPVLILGASALSPASRAGDTPRTVEAVRVAHPPVLDGIPSEEVWKLAPPAGPLTQRDPDEGKPALVLLVVDGQRGGSD